LSAEELKNAFDPSSYPEPMESTPMVAEAKPSDGKSDPA
jgi:hypothetical protein